MSTFSVTLPSGQQVSVNVPPAISFDPPVEPERARYLMALDLAQRIEPHVIRRPTVQHVVRDSGGRITGLREFEGDPPARELAWRAATQLIEQVIPVNQS